MKKIILNKREIKIEKILLIGNDNTVNKVNYNKLQPEILTVSVNRIWMTYFPDVIYVIDPEIFREIQIKIDKKELDYIDFRNTIIFYNFYLTKEFENLLKNITAYPVNIKRNNSLISIMLWFNHNYENLLFFIYGVSLLYDKEKNHFWKGDKDVLNNRDSNWENDKYKKNFNQFNELKKNVNMISVMKKSRLNEILEVRKIDILFKKLEKKILIIRPKNVVFRTFCDAIRNTLLEITNSKVYLVRWNLSTLSNIIDDFDVIIIIQLGILKKIKKLFYNKKIIIFNTEPLELESNNYLKELFIEFQHNLILEYSCNNLPILDNLGCYNKILFPIGYLSFYDKFLIPKKMEKDIDFLFIGNITNRRKKILEILENLGYKVSYYDNVFDDMKKAKLINRSKICLDIFRTEFNNNNMHRLNELITHKSFIISELGKDILINKLLNNIIIQVDYNNILEMCLKYINKSEEFREKFTLNSHKLYIKRFSMRDQFIKIL